MEIASQGIASGFVFHGFGRFQSVGTLAAYRP